jgi:NTE family protein
MLPENPSLFDGLSEEEQAATVCRLPVRRFPAGTTLIAQGDTVVEIYVIRSGTVEILLPDRHGTERSLNWAGPGATFGEMAFFTGQPASASVRARSDVDVLVLNGEEFLSISTAFPRIYRNVGAILSSRLMRSNRLALRPPAGRLVLLRNNVAPPLLGYALACSIAWHTRRSVLMLVLSDRPSPELAVFQEGGGSSVRLTGGDLGTTRHGASEARAHLVLAEPTGPFAAENLAATLEDVCAHYPYVLVQVEGEPQAPLAAASQVYLIGTKGFAPSPTNARPGHAVCAWVESARQPRPGPDGVLRVPPLRPADEPALRRGLLPTGTPAGRVLGWKARDVANLKLGLALGGGTEKGYAHLGVRRVLQRAGIEPDYLAGTSIGSVAATAWALGYDVDGSCHAMDTVGAQLYRPTIPTASFLSSAGLRAGLKQFTQRRRIEDLEMPLAIVAADIIRGQEVVFRSGLVWQAVLASCSLPGIYPPQCIGPYTLVDGGLLSPVPSNVAADMGADIVIAVKLNNIPISAPQVVEAQEAKGRPPWALQTIWRCIDIMYNKIEAVSTHAATIVITPTFEEAGYGLRNFRAGRAYIAQGEKAAEAALPRIVAALPWLRT